MINNGAKINDKDDRGMNAVLHSALNGHLSLLKYLVERGGDITSRDMRE